MRQRASDEDAINVLRSAPRGESVPLVPLFERQKSRRAMICLFLALLEMVKQQALKLTQKESFGEIHAKRDVGFDALLTSDDQVARIENDYKN